MRKQTVVAVVLTVLLAASASAQATDFFELVKTGTAQDVQTAIDKGANVNDVLPAGDAQHMGKTPLMMAARYNQSPEVIAVLLKAGADVNAVDALHSTALIWAAGGNNVEVIATLLKAGADIKVKALSGATALMWAANGNRNPAVILALLKAGADINAKNDHGWTPLVYAAKNNPNPEVVLTLLKAGADAKGKDDYGQTVLDYAQNNYSLNGTDALRELEKASK